MRIYIVTYKPHADRFGPEDSEIIGVFTDQTAMNTFMALNHPTYGDLQRLIDN
jgi:hypothetical protein